MEICAQKEGEWRSISIFFQVVQKAGTELIKYCVLYSPFDNKENEDEVGFLRWWIQFCLIKSQNDRRGFRSSSAEVVILPMFSGLAGEFNGSFPLILYSKNSSGRWMYLWRLTQSGVRKLPGNGENISTDSKNIFSEYVSPRKGSYTLLLSSFWRWTKPVSSSYSGNTSLSSSSPQWDTFIIIDISNFL